MADSFSDYSPNDPTPTKKSVSYFHTKKHALLDFHSYTHTRTHTQCQSETLERNLTGYWDESTLKRFWGNVSPQLIMKWARNLPWVNFFGFQHSLCVRLLSLPFPWLVGWLPFCLSWAHLKTKVVWKLSIKSYFFYKFTIPKMPLGRAM